MRELPHPPRCRGTLCLLLRYAHLWSWMRFPHRNDPRAALRGNRAVRPRTEPRVALRYVQTGLPTFSTSPPSPPSLPACSLCQRRCRPPLRSGPAGDCRCACRSDWRHRDGEHSEFRPLGGFDLACGRIELGTGLSLSTDKNLPILSKLAPAHYNLSALYPGLAGNIVV